MKKALLIIAVIILLSGCGMKTETLTCTNENTVGNMTSKTTYKIDYSGNEVKMLTVMYEYHDDHTDGVGTGTDGTTDDTDKDTDGIVDGVVGEALDDVVTSVADTIIDIAGIRTMHNNRFGNYSDTEGFKTMVDNNNNDNDYKVTYTYDFTKLSDSDITTFGLNRNYNTLRSQYATNKAICK